MVFPNSARGQQIDSSITPPVPLNRKLRMPLHVRVQERLGRVRLIFDIESDDLLYRKNEQERVLTERDWKIMSNADLPPSNGTLRQPASRYSRTSMSHVLNHPESGTCCW